MNPLLVLLYAGFVVFAIYRQFATQKALSVSLLMVPALMAFAMTQTVGGYGLPPLNAAAIVFLAVNGALSVVLGVWRGFTFKIWAAADGTAMRRGTWWTVASWLLLIGLRISVAVVASRAGIKEPEMIVDLMASLFLTFAAQNIVVWQRAIAAAAGAQMAVR
jgi:hypothetical protein